MPENTALNSTSVCHYFAKEWVKMGHRVVCVHLYPIYGRLFYQFAKVWKYQIGSLSGVYVAAERLDDDCFFEQDGVQICRFSSYKPIPRGKLSNNEITRLTEKIFRYCDSIGFKPDFITNHLSHQNVKVVCRLKKYYPDAVACSVSHGADKELKLYSPFEYKKILNAIDIWGFRSVPIRNKFESLYGKNRPMFQCYSGIDEKIIRKTPKPFDKASFKFIYVGSFIKRKHPKALVKALYRSFGKNTEAFNLTYVGKGDEKDSIIETAKSCGIAHSISFTGHLKREEVYSRMAESDCFIMISENESFGLVYLEAMSQGCITIASRNEGMDGIIKHGENGFLCTAGDDKELSEIIDFIRSLSKEELQEISINAIETADAMTNYKVAYDYIKNLLDIQKKKYSK